MPLSIAGPPPCQRGALVGFQPHGAEILGTRMRGGFTGQYTSPPDTRHSGVRVLHLNSSEPARHARDAGKWLRRPRGACAACVWLGDNSGNPRASTYGALTSQYARLRRRRGEATPLKNASARARQGPSLIFGEGGWGGEVFLEGLREPEPGSSLAERCPLTPTPSPRFGGKGRESFGRARWDSVAWRSVVLKGTTRTPFPRSGGKGTGDRGVRKEPSPKSAFRPQRAKRRMVSRSEGKGLRFTGHD
jgi:hypothetical protein